MTAVQLTRYGFGAMLIGMKVRTRSGQIKMSMLAMAAFGLTAGGCVNVTAPDKPIVINLNINIKQEVVYRLAGDAKEAINENAEIF